MGDLFDMDGELAGYVKVAHAIDVPEGGGLQVHVRDKDIALFKVDGSVYAIENACPHQFYPLHEGELCGTTVTCPLHAWRFDVTTGLPPGGVAAFPRVSTFAVKLSGGAVWLDPVARRTRPPLPPPYPRAGS